MVEMRTGTFAQLGVWSPVPLSAITVPGLAERRGLVDQPRPTCPMTEGEAVTAVERDD